MIFLNHKQTVSIPDIFGIFVMFYCQYGYVVGNLMLKRPLQFGCHFQCLCIFFYVPFAGANISYAPACTQTINKRGPPEVSELVANHADSLQLHIRGVLLTRRFHFTLVLPEIKIVVNKIAAVCHVLDFTHEFTTILSVPQLQMRRWK